MLAHGRAQHIAADLLLACFDFLELPDLLRLALVSRHWRDTVLSHRTYWGTHVLRSGDEERAQYFLDRLDKSEGRPVTTRIIVRSPALLPSRVFPAITKHLSHTLKLTVSLSSARISDIFTALLSPAPILAQFRLEFNADVPAPTLPGNIFLGVAPALRLCILQHVQLPEPAPFAFRTVETLEYGLYNREPFSQHTVASAFPRIHTLMLEGRFSWNASNALWSSQWNNMDTLVLSLGRSTLKDAISNIPISRIRCILVAQVRYALIPRFMSDLVGELELCFQDFSDHESAFRVIFRDAATNLTRGFTLQSTVEFDRYAFVSSDIAARITRLSIPAGAAFWRPHVRSLPSFRVLVDLELVAYGRCDLTRLIGVDVLLCPQLQTLTLRSDRNMAYFTTMDIALFAREALRGAHYPITLTLHNVLLDGDQRAFEHFFRAITCTTTTEKIYPYPYWES